MGETPFFISLRKQTFEIDLKVSDSFYLFESTLQYSSSPSLRLAYSVKAIDL